MKFLRMILSGDKHASLLDAFESCKKMNRHPGVFFTTLIFFCYWQMGPISQSITLQLVRKTFQGQTHQLIGPICKLHKRSAVNRHPGIVFTTLYFLRNLQLGKMSQSITLKQVGNAGQGQTDQLIGPICKLHKRSAVNRHPGFVFTTLHFLRNLQMGPISQSITLQQVGKTFQGQICQLIGRICKLRKK